MTPLDACLPGQRWPRARRSSAGSDFVSILWLQALSSLHQTPIGTLARIRFASVSQKLVRSLTRPFKVDLARSPVVSGLGQGAEPLEGTPFGAPRMFGGEVDLQSSGPVAGLGPGASSALSTRAQPSLLKSRSRLQLDGSIIHLRSSTSPRPGGDPSRRRAPC